MSQSAHEIATAPAAGGRASVSPLALGDFVTRQLTSVRFGVLLLFILALGAVAGTFIESIWDTPTAQRLVYHHWWYIAVMLLLALTLNAASWPYYVTAIRLPRVRPLRRRRDQVESLPVARRIEGAISAKSARTALERHIGRVTVEGNAMFAQRGFLQRWGFIVTHIGITMLLAGGTFLSMGAHFAGPPGASIVFLGEGLTADMYLEPDPDNPEFMRRRPLPFQLVLHDFDAEMFPGTNVPRFFGSIVQIIAPDGTSSMHEITMNEALQWRGWKLSQNSYTVLDATLAEETARQHFAQDGEGFVHLIQEGRLAIELTDTRSGRRYPTFDAGVGSRVPVPQSDHLFFETVDGQTFAVIRGAETLGEGALGAVDSDAPFAARISGRLPAAYSGLGVMRESQALKGFFYVSFFLFGLGPFIAFSQLFAQVWVWVAPDGSGAVVGGRARGRRAALPGLIERIARDMEEAPQP